MEPRLNIAKVAPGAYQAMAGLESYIRQSSRLEPPLLELVKMRASQINGCAYCLDMHSKDARAAGESEQRLYRLSTWRETPFYTERERAALAWTEAITLISSTHAPDEIYEEVRKHFTEEELGDLTLAIVAINGWNRFTIGFRSVPGTYQPAKARSTLSALKCLLPNVFRSVTTMEWCAAWMKITLSGGPTALRETSGLHLLTDPTFDLPGGGRPDCQAACV